MKTTKKMLKNDKHYRNDFTGEVTTGDNWLADLVYHLQHSDELPPYNELYDLVEVLWDDSFGELDCTNRAAWKEVVNITYK